MWIYLAIRLVVFVAVFWVAARNNEKVVFDKKWALPIVALAFAILNAALYLALKPIAEIVTLGVVGFAMPMVLNLFLLAVTVRIFQSRKWFHIDGLFAMLWMATFLTIAHGALWLVGHFAKLA